MKPTIFLLPALAALLAVSQPAGATPVSTAFNYQGRLEHNGAPATGTFDLKFQLYTEGFGGTLAAPAVEMSNIAVSAGLISLDLDFGGPTVFDGESRWLEIAARPSGTATYVTLPGRTAIRPTPYSIHALRAATIKDGAVGSSSLASGAVTTSKLASGAVTSTNLASGAVRLANLDAAVPPAVNAVLSYNGSGFGWQLPQNMGQWGNTAANDGVYHFGKVGIGTATPGTKLTVVAAGYGLEHTNGPVRLATFTGGTSHTAGWLGTISNHPLSFFTNSSDSRMTISAAGDVGIGTSAPGAKLEVAGQHVLLGKGFQPLVTLTDTNSNTSTRIQSAGGEINFFPGSYMSGANTNSWVKVSNTGNVSMTSCTIRGGADLAEPFAMSHDGVEPGTVVVIDAAHPGKLKASTRAYDKKVAGIVSGANGIQPGISLIQEDKLEAGQNVALSGRVYVKADTSAGTIEPGDLLTTSGTAGRAMKAADHSRAQGAIIGKAMTPLTDDEGMVLVLVTLQ